jgi:hypothetical protein
VERLAAAALAEQLTGWTCMEQMAGSASREQFLAALDVLAACEASEKSAERITVLDGPGKPAARRLWAKSR